MSEWGIAMPKRITIGRVLPFLIMLGTSLAGSRAACASSQAAAVDTAASMVSEDILWSFGVSNTDAASPTGGVIKDKWGNLYGTTSGGGAYCASTNLCGTVFELSPPADYQSP